MDETASHRILSEFKLPTSSPPEGKRKTLATLLKNLLLTHFIADRPVGSNPKCSVVLFSDAKLPNNQIVKNQFLAWPPTARTRDAACRQPTEAMKGTLSGPGLGRSLTSERGS